MVVVVPDRETLHFGHLLLLEWMLGVEQGSLLEPLEIRN